MNHSNIYMDYVSKIAVEVNIQDDYILYALYRKSL